ncbi:transposase [Advenella faeciporci]|uniref:transposase n=1 Tax=Advenella faeciporci TaxID=797535 RepID=UPI003570BC1B
MAILKLAEQVMKVTDICCEHGISNATYYQWKSKYGGLEASDLKRLRDIEAENTRLKKCTLNWPWKTLQLRICWESSNSGATT